MINRYSFMLNIIPLKWNQRLVSVFFYSIDFVMFCIFQRTFFTLNNNEQSMRLQCLGLTCKCYILWSGQLDDTRAGTRMYININSDKQKLFAHWSQMNYLVTGSTNSFPFSHCFMFSIMWLKRLFYKLNPFIWPMFLWFGDWPLL